MDKPTLRTELEQMLNRHSAENVSNTPDFILAEYLIGCLNNFDKSVKDREAWYGRATKSIQENEQSN